MGVTIRQKPPGSGVWWVFVNHAGRRKSKRIGRDKRLAQKVAEQIAARLTLGDVGIVNKSPTFSDLARQWFTVHVPAKCKQTTERAYQSILEKHVLPGLDNVKIHDLTRLKIKNHFLKLVNTGVSVYLVR